MIAFTGKVKSILQNIKQVEVWFSTPGDHGCEICFFPFTGKCEFQPGDEVEIEMKKLIPEPVPSVYVRCDAKPIPGSALVGICTLPKGHKGNHFLEPEQS